LCMHAMCDRNSDSSRGVENHSAARKIWHIVCIADARLPLAQLMKKATRAQKPANIDFPTRAPSPFLLALESRAFLEWAACIASWPLLNLAARGDGHPVL